MEPTPADPLSEPRAQPVYASPPPRRARRRFRIGPRGQLLLLLLTLLSLAFAGGLQWEGVGAEDHPLQWFGPSVLLEILSAGWVYAFWVFMILGCHEMGHYLACRYYRIPATLPFFVPGPPPLGSFGAVIRIRGVIPDRRALFDVAAAGPLAGFAVALPVLLVGLLRAEPMAPPAEQTEALFLGPPLLVVALRALLLPADGVLNVGSLFGAGWVGMLVTSLNLFPVGQLDGGHAAYAVSRRLHRVLARLTLVSMALLLFFHGYYLRQFPAYLLWFAILLWMRDRHPRLMDEVTPLGKGRVLVALLLALVFLSAFIPIPFIFVQ